MKECHKIDPGHATLPALRKFQLFCENGGGIWRGVVSVIIDSSYLKEGCL